MTRPAPARTLPRVPARVLAGATAVGLVVWSSRVVGILALAGGLLAGPRRMLGEPFRASVGLPEIVGVGQVVVTVVAGVGMLLLAAGLRRRKRRAWALAVVITAALTAVNLARVIGPAHGHAAVAAAVTALLLGLLVVTRRSFPARSDPGGVTRAARVLVQFAVAGVGVVWLFLALNPHRLAPGTSASAQLDQALLALVGVSGPVAFAAHGVWLDDLTATVGLTFGVLAVLGAGYFLLRSPEPESRLEPADEARLRAMLARRPDPDSLDYFALRRDRTVAYAPSGGAAVSYRVLAGVALASGDPLGEQGEWNAAIAAFLDRAVAHAWVPAVLACSEDGATAWARAGFSVLEFGDEAVLDTAAFTLEGRTMRGVRQTVARAERAGFTVRVRRLREIDPEERTELARLARSWRGDAEERGFSMALSRTADGTDGEAVLAVAHRDGVPAALLQFVPWGRDGLSLDLMRRDPAADGGLTEQLVVEVVRWAGGHGIARVSLNFAVFRGALERGQRLGAGPVARLWARILHVASRWWQIESLYRFNAKFRPCWVPRFLLFPAVRDLPRVLLAMLEAEGFGGRPPALLRMLRR
ncbi:phosphatidylglycerol lysyltransferase domain-containing protein [Pseudonocardia halophobica]|uniref:phosphatidylglycerol lysyltransferase domain-containing protein n=1 Tax=Pseudonocardia halophobica TaxID=29401 RepID=UPI003D8C6A16